MIFACHVNLGIRRKEVSIIYKNINAYLVSVALTEIIGYDLGEFIETNIFQPMGITKYEFGRSSEGYFYGASKMKLTVHDLSKMGLLMCHVGGYGYYFWKYRDGFSINGKWMQRCYCLPKQEMMVTYLANIQEHSQELLHSMEINLLG